MRGFALALLATAACWSSSSGEASKPAPPPGGEWQPMPEPQRQRADERAPPVAAGCDEVSCLLDPTPACCRRFKPPKPGPRPGPTVPVTLDRQAIAAGMAAVKGRVIACGNQSGVRGMLKVRVAVAPNGRPTVAIAQALDPAIDRCVVGVVGTAVFPRAASPTTFVYPFLF